jgi:hypothetical protein
MEVGKRRSGMAVAADILLCDPCHDNGGDGVTVSNGASDDKIGKRSLFGTIWTRGFGALALP